MKLSVISLALIPMLSLTAVQAAVYDVVEVGDVPEVRFNSAAKMNDIGEAVFNGGISSIALSDGTNVFTPLSILSQGDGRSYYDFPLDLDAIDFTSARVKVALTEQQIADAINGITDASSLSILMSNNFANQPRGLALPYFKATNATAQNVISRDFAVEPLRGNTEYLNDINNQSVAVGFASTPFTRGSFTTEPSETSPDPITKVEWLPEGPIVLGTVVKEGMVKTIPAVYQELGGGFSLAYAINNQGAIAGITSVDMSETMKERVLATCLNKTESEAVCINRLAFAGTKVIEPLNINRQLDTLLQSQSYYQHAGAVWHLNGDTLSEPQFLGFLGDKNTGVAFDGEEHNKVHYVSRPYDINDKGLVVGSSVYTDSDKEVRFLVGDIVKTGIYRTYHAALFVENQAMPLLDDETQWIRSAAVAINNNDIIVGGALKNFQGITKVKMFTHDYSSGQTNFIKGFFDSSSTVVRDINDNNIIVGKAETLSTTTSVRRERAFIMDLADNSFLDLNSFLSCNSPYTLVDATSINNNGEILATALTKKEQRDLKGNLVLDASGAPILDTVTTTVKLTPIANGEPDGCIDEDANYQRKGGSFSFVWILGLALIGWRRFKH